MSSADTTSTIETFVLLDADRVLDALADAGDDDFLDWVRIGCPSGLVLRQRGSTARGEKNGEPGCGRHFGMRAALGRLAAITFLA